MRYRPSRKVFRPSKELSGVLATVVLLALFSLVSPLKNRLEVSYAYGAWFVRQFTYAAFEEVFYPWKSSVSLQSSGSADSAQGELQVLQKENEELKTLLGRKPLAGEVLARILTKPPQAPYDEITLDLGAQAGITEGAQIFDENNSLIGAVFSVSSNFSKARLFSSPGITTEAELFGKGNIFELVGQGDGSFIFEAPRDFSIEAGDIFVLPGLRSKPLAKVVDIKSNPEDSFKKVYARGFFEPRTLTWVFAEIKNQ